MKKSEKVQINYAASRKLLADYAEYLLEKFQNFYRYCQFLNILMVIVFLMSFALLVLTDWSPQEIRIQGGICAFLGMLNVVGGLFQGYLGRCKAEAVALLDIAQKDDYAERCLAFEEFMLKHPRSRFCRQ